METVKPYESVKFTRGGKEAATDQVMVEETIELLVNGTKLSSIVTTPGQRKELAVGYLVTEGAVTGKDDILGVMEDGSRVDVEVRSFEHFDLWYELRSSGCIGVNWDKRDEDLMVMSRQRFSVGIVLDSLRYLYSEEQDTTRGTHSACLISAEGELKYKALDIGRHNAIDKVMGAATLAGEDLTKMFLLSSGRQPAGMVLKAARAGIPLVVSKAAPISSGIDGARRVGLTLACFADKEKVKVFSRPDRIIP